MVAVLACRRRSRLPGPPRAAHPLRVRGPAVPDLRLPDGVRPGAGQRQCPSRGGRSPPPWSPTSSAGASASSPIVSHTGVSSAEPGEPSYPERYRVPGGTAERVNAARADGHRVIAVGTTVTRAWRGGRRAGPGASGAGVDRAGGHARTGAGGGEGLVTGWHQPAGSIYCWCRRWRVGRWWNASTRPRWRVATGGTSSATSTSSSRRPVSRSPTMRWPVSAQTAIPRLGRGGRGRLCRPRPLRPPPDARRPRPPRAARQGGRGRQRPAPGALRLHRRARSPLSALVEPARITWVEESTLDRGTHRTEFHILADH